MCLAHCSSQERSHKNIHRHVFAEQAAGTGAAHLRERPARSWPEQPQGLRLSTTEVAEAALRLVSPRHNEESRGLSGKDPALDRVLGVEVAPP